MSKKRTIDGFFKPTEIQKQSFKPSEDASRHHTYPNPVPHLPPAISDLLGFCPEVEGRAIDDQPDLDLLYFEPYIPKGAQRPLFEFLRQALFFYLVRYKIKRGAIETQVNTPRFTTVFGVDETSVFATDGSLLDAETKRPVQKDKYKCDPRPIPQCLDMLRKLTEGTTGETFNFCLVNYYADGNHSISYHSDDERFLGTNPAIASFSLGAKRDFLLKHKPVVDANERAATTETKTLKLPLASGDMILMRGRTQSNWLHSIPKRKGGPSDAGRINITFRKALVRGGTENYYQYNVGDGGAYRWNSERGDMCPL